MTFEKRYILKWLKDTRKQEKTKYLYLTSNLYLKYLSTDITEHIYIILQGKTKKYILNMYDLDNKIIVKELEKVYANINTFGINRTIRKYYKFFDNIEKISY